MTLFLSAASLEQEHEAQNIFLKLLAENPQRAWLESKDLEHSLVRDRILFGDKPIPLIFAPIVLSNHRWQQLSDKMAQLNQLLTRLEPRLHEKHWLDWLGFAPQEQEWIRIDNQARSGRAISRVDGFLSEDPSCPNSYQIVELNIDSPGGAAFLDVASATSQKSGLWQEFSELAPGRTIPFSDALYDHLDLVWRDFLEDHPELSSSQGRPRIAIVDWITVSTHREFDLLAEGLRKRGYDAIVADPRELQYKGERLRDYDGRPIDLLYRRVLVEDMLRDPLGSSALIKACRAGTCCIINSFSSKPLTVKSLLALFHDPAGRQLLSESECKLVDEIIPLTLKLDKESASKVKSEQERFVLKPSDGWGAQGLYLGWRCTKQEWAEHLRRCSALGGYVAQERVAIPSRSLPTWTGSGWENFNYMYDISPYSLSENAVCPLVRLSPSEVLNVKQGAQIATVWVLD